MTAEALQIVGALVSGGILTMLGAIHMRLGKLVGEITGIKDRVHNLEYRIEGKAEK